MSVAEAFISRVFTCTGCDAEFRVSQPYDNGNMVLAPIPLTWKKVATYESGGTYETTHYCADCKESH